MNPKNYSLSMLIELCLDNGSIEYLASTHNVAVSDLQRWLDGSYWLDKLEIETIFALLLKHLKSVETDKRIFQAERDLLQARLDEIKEITDGLKPR